MKHWILAFAALATGCAHPKCCDVIDTAVHITYRDASGGDWLRTNNVTAEKMENYSVCGGTKTRVFQGNYDAPKMLRLYREPDTARTTLQVYPNDCGAAVEESVTLLEFPDHSVDTLRCRFDHHDGNVVCTAARYNGKLRWSNQQGGIRAFTVTK